MLPISPLVVNRSQKCSVRPQGYKGGFDVTGTRDRKAIAPGYLPGKLRECYQDIETSWPGGWLTFHESCASVLEALANGHSLRRIVNSTTNNKVYRNLPTHFILADQNMRRVRVISVFIWRYFILHKLTIVNPAYAAKRVRVLNPDILIPDLRGLDHGL